jgi:hypothetical protein
MITWTISPTHYWDAMELFLSTSAAKIDGLTTVGRSKTPSSTQPGQCHRGLKGPGEATPAGTPTSRQETAAQQAEVRQTEGSQKRKGVEKDSTGDKPAFQCVCFLQRILSCPSC